MQVQRRGKEKEVYENKVNISEYKSRPGKLMLGKKNHIISNGLN